MMLLSMSVGMQEAIKLIMEANISKSLRGENKMRDNKELSVVQVVHDLHLKANVPVEIFAQRCNISEKEVKQIIKKGTIPDFDKKIRILNTFKGLWKQINAPAIIILDKQEA